jgi:hypothetical protein
MVNQPFFGFTVFKISQNLIFYCNRLVFGEPEKTVLWFPAVFESNGYHMYFCSVRSTFEIDRMIPQ